MVLLIAMALTASYGWTVERVAYRPLRGSFRLAPLISAIGMSFVLPNFVQIAQGARNKPLPPMIPGGRRLKSSDGFDVNISKSDHRRLDAGADAGFTWLVARTRSAATCAPASRT